MNILSEMAQHFNISPALLQNQLSLSKAKQIDPGVSGKVNVWRSFEESPDTLDVFQGVRQQYWHRRIPDMELRRIADRCTPIGICVNTMKDKVLPFCQKSTDDKKPGYTIALIDDEKEPTKENKEKMKHVSKWFGNTGRRDFEGHEEREDDMSDYLQQLVEDYMVLGKESTELRRDVSGNMVDYRIVDSGTIKRTIKGGFMGDSKFIDPNNYVYVNSEFYRKLINDKTKLVPSNPEDIAFVQSFYYNDRYVAAFSRKDMIFDTIHPRSDVRFKGLGISYIEQMVSIITLWLNGIAFNSEGLSHAAIPKIGLNLEDGTLGRGQMIQMQDDWKNNYQGIDQWRIPILQGKWKTIDLLKSPRDMEYMGVMDLVGALIHGIYGIDSAETGMNFRQSKAILSEGSGSRLKHSKSRGLNTILFAITGVMNKIMMQSGWGDEYTFKFTGIEPEDRKTDSDLETAATKRETTINELRAKKDMKPDPYGDIILDPSYIQYRTQMEQQKQQEEMGEVDEDQESGLSDEEMAGIAEDSMEDVFKAIDPDSIRTLLKTA